jgi:hypothetical protein
MRNDEKQSPKQLEEGDHRPASRSFAKVATTGTK